MEPITTVGLQISILIMFSFPRHLAAPISLPTTKAPASGKTPSIGPHYVLPPLPPHKLPPPQSILQPQGMLPVQTMPSPQAQPTTQSVLSPLKITYPKSNPNHSPSPAKVPSTRQQRIQSPLTPLKVGDQHVMLHNVLTPQINVPPHTQPPRAMTEMTLLTPFEPKSPKDPVVWMPVHITEVIPTVPKECQCSSNDFNCGC